MRKRLTVAASLIGLLMLFCHPAMGAQTVSSSVPSVFDITASGAAMTGLVSASYVLPLDIEYAGFYSGVKMTSQPYVVAQGAPLYLPVLESLGLVGGPWGVVKLIPGLVVGLPSLYGLPAIPLDPGMLGIPVDSPIPMPDVPALTCKGVIPGEPQEASCMGPVYMAGDITSAFGNSTVKTGGDIENTRTLFADSITRAFGAGMMSTVGGSPLFSVDAVASGAHAGASGDNMRVSAWSEVAGLEIAGVLKIKAIKASIVADVAGTAVSGGSQLARETCTIAGASFLNYAVSIDMDGVHVVGQNSPGLPIADGQAALNAALAASGISVKANPAGKPTVSADGTQVEAKAGCLELSYHIAASDSLFKWTFAQAQMSAYAFQVVEEEYASDSSATASDFTSDTSSDVSLPVDVAGNSEFAATDATEILPASEPATGAEFAEQPAASDIQALGDTTAAAGVVYPDGGWRNAYKGFIVLALAVTLLLALRRLHLVPRRSRSGGA